MPGIFGILIHKLLTYFFFDNIPVLVLFSQYFLIEALALPVLEYDSQSREGELFLVPIIFTRSPFFKILVSKKASPSLHLLQIAKTGKARAAIRRYWHNKTYVNTKKDKKYLTGLCIKIPNLPGKYFLSFLV